MANTLLEVEITSLGIPAFTFDLFTGVPICSITHAITSDNTPGSTEHPADFDAPLTWTGTQFQAVLIESLRQTVGDYTFYERITSGTTEYFSPLMTLRLFCGPDSVVL